MTAGTLIDVSNNNGGAEDYRAVRNAGIDGVWLKVSEGGNFTDATYLPRKAAALAAGLHVGGYHMLRRDSDVRAQTLRFIALLGDGCTLRPMIDAEHQYDAHGQVIPTSWPHADDVDLCGTILEQHYGFEPVLYSYDSFLMNELGADARLRRFPLDIAAYTASTPMTPWPWAGWQFTDRAQVPGVPGPVDQHHVPDISALLVPLAPVPPVTITPEATVYLCQEKGSQTVHAIGAGPNGVTDIIGRPDNAYLNAWKAALIQQTGRAEAANVVPVEPGFVANIRNGH